MENFVLAGKAKTVFQILELMARGEEQGRAVKNNDTLTELVLNKSIPLWPARN